MATAVVDLYPGTKVSIGPPIENGFYYDFEFPEGVSLSDADLERIEEKMREHIKADEAFERTDIPVAEALERFRAEDQPYKVELIEDLIENEGVETVSLYANGPFTDLCRGPHAPSTGRIEAIKLNSLAGRLLARRRDPPDAHPHLRHRLLLARRTSTHHLERIEMAPSQRSPPPRPRARPVHLPRRSRRACRSGCRRGRSC